jgi:hypothetical protein
MPRGGRRPGSGRPRKALSRHLIAGSFRTDRHGPRPAAGTVLAMPLPSEDWRPSPEDEAALGPRARRWLTSTVALYRLTSIEGEQVLLAMRSLDRLAQLEATFATAGVTSVDAGTLLTAISREARTFQSAWAAVRLERA